MSWKKFILLGDSNTQFSHGLAEWVNKVSDLFQRKSDVINRGFSGYSSEHIRIILPRLLSEFKPELVCGIVVMLGSNDSTDASSEIQHVPLNRFRENISYIVDYLINWGIPKDKIILVSPAKIYDEKWIKALGPRAAHRDFLVKDYAEQINKIAREKEVLFFDFRKAMDDYGSDYHVLLHDGLHLSKEGGDLLYQGLLQILNDNILKDLKLNYPDWKELQPNQKEINQF